ncbi:CNOT7 isoform 4 [Pan troglodytes]|uniref:CCR4-NOT transcription complex subunit 7 n=4 Tax=Homininae TaxID=207598 RepID=E5RGA8_HUMAN|nr:CCR4-NOT transcription complex subunit 7 [Homo sapiens]KAI4009637.1 CCR4-NOT transcription complex subunit 7 [Homo sapiens]PNI34850.1 CNOT7 isoform 4 [Pan troglodytes]
MPAATVDHSQRICEVWACNLDEEMKKIRQVIRKYNYVAMGFGVEKNLVSEKQLESTGRFPLF